MAPPMKLLLCSLFCGLILQVNNAHLSPYSPTWESLDARPIPTWYDEAKVGIFLHWGIFSVPSFGNEWFWKFWHEGSKDYVDFMKKNYPPGFTYGDFASLFSAELFKPEEWADIFKAAGARYVVLTTKHHEGFTNWPSKYSFNWNSMDVGPKRDLVGDLTKAVRNRTDIHMGLYHSLGEWYNPLMLEDVNNSYTTQYFAKRKAIPELYEIVNAYQPEVLFSDGTFYGNDDYWGSKDFLAWLYNDSPVKDKVVVNDRWGNNTSFFHGGYWSGNDRYNPKILQKHKFENAMTLDRGGWGYRREATLGAIFTIEELLAELVTTVSCGGNILMNVGPTKYGKITPIFEERLRQVGQWLSTNGEAIYSSKPWIYQNDTVNPDIWYTARKPEQGGLNVYAILLKWPKGDNLYLGAPKPSESTRVTLLGYPGAIQWKKEEQGGLSMKLNIPFSDMPSMWAWVFELEHLLN